MVQAQYYSKMCIKKVIKEENWMFLLFKFFFKCSHLKSNSVSFTGHLLVWRENIFCATLSFSDENNEAYKVLCCALSYRWKILKTLIKYWNKYIKFCWGFGRTPLCPSRSRRGMSVFHLLIFPFFYVYLFVLFSWFTPLLFPMVGDP